ncbi:unnamed protein product [Clonostachys rosea]|uniref:FAD/NAD(P)-binding domain-containing protein n=1 Tax=Bionectria ochroleuca TaxID=29856 RepID=A0ABY6UCD8_BIOOC|nr:unnamed protein product [Clonostachys rosea]
MGGEKKTRTVAVIGAGASGTITAAALQAENYFTRIRVFERRESPGGTWIYDEGTKPHLPVKPGDLPGQSDPPLEIPQALPTTTAPNQQNRFLETPIYSGLTTNVPAIAMSFSDAPFAYGPFVPHYVPQQYLANYFSTHKLDSLLELNTALEDLTEVKSDSREKDNGWKLTLRKRDLVQNVDIWWEEYFDAVVLANGHYTVPFVPHVKGLDEYIKKFPGRVIHSKSYRVPHIWKGKKAIVIGNSASGKDVSTELVKWVSLPLYQSRRSKSRWDGEEPPPGIEWKPIITEYLSDGGIVFADGTILQDIDVVVYATGYKPSFPFWNLEKNGRPLYDYENGKLIDSYWHTWFRDFPTLALVGLPRVLTFRSMEYQAIAIARLLSGRQWKSLPPIKEQIRWELERLEKSKANRTKFHDVVWDEGETQEYLGLFFRIAGLGTLLGEGRVPPVLSKETIWAIENIKKYPEPGRDNDTRDGFAQGEDVQSEGPDWVVAHRPNRGALWFI